MRSRLTRIGSCLLIITACKSPIAGPPERPKDKPTADVNGAGPPLPPPGPTETPPGDQDPQGPCIAGDPNCGGSPGKNGRGAPGWCGNPKAKKFDSRDIDFDADTKPDQFCREPGGVLSIMYADGTTWDVSTPWCAEPDSKISLEDNDKDGRTDLICADRFSRIYVLLANQQGTFDLEQTPVDLWCSAPGAQRFIGADFDGDGKNDEFCAEPQGNKMWRFGRGITTSALSLWCTHTGSWIEVFDANGDGRSDLICRDSANRQWLSYSRQNGSFAFDP